jgi:uncharacterized protein DUF3108
MFVDANMMRNFARLLMIAATAAALCPAEGLKAEALEYRVDWKLWHAGDINLAYEPGVADSDELPHAEVTLRTQGFVNDLYSVDNHYRVRFNDEFCADSYEFKVKEGSKRRLITTTYQKPKGRANYRDRDLVRGRIASRKTIRVPHCAHDELTALAKFRTMSLEAGESVEIPISNGKKSASAKITRQQKETIKTPLGSFEAVRYEVFLFNNVLYRRKGRLFVWLTDDERRLPVQFQLRLRVYYGTITLQLVKEETH